MEYSGTSCHHSAHMGVLYFLLKMCSLPHVSSMLESLQSAGVCLVFASHQRAGGYVEALGAVILSVD